MNEVGGINGPQAPASVTQRQPVTERRGAETDYRTPHDEVEISELGTMLAKLRELPDVRVEKVTRIKVEIEAGNFETPERLAGTFERLLEELAQSAS